MERPSQNGASLSYAIYIAATADDVWDALTDEERTLRYWDHRNVSKWTEGSTWEHRRPDGSAVDAGGTVLEATRPSQLAFTWAAPGVAAESQQVTFDLESHGGVVRLTVTVNGITEPDMFEGFASGWPAVLSNLKTFVETGKPMPNAPWTLAFEPWSGARN